MRTTRKRTTGRPLRSGPLACGLAAVLGAGALTGCAQDSGGSGGEEDGRTTLSVGVFGVFGYKQAGLYDEYEKLHPDIRIKENSTERNEDYYPALLNHLSANSGLSDIQAVEVDNINEVAGLHADKLVDMAKVEGIRKSDWLGWKWNQAKADSGQVVGLGTDIGPMGVCYRKDLFAKAGLPTDRKKVGKLWQGDWSKYVDAGAEYMKSAPEGTAFMDGAAGLYNGAVSSYPVKYYSADGKLVYKKSEGVRESWDLAMRAIEGDMTGKLKQFDKEWDQGYANGDFASVVCPPWMLGYIKEKAGDKGAGKWDVAAAPRPANWGGSFLTVPKGGKHREEAVELAKWLADRTRAAGQAVREAGQLPQLAGGLRTARGQGSEAPVLRRRAHREHLLRGRRGHPHHPARAEGPGDQDDDLRHRHPPGGAAGQEAPGGLGRRGEEDR